MGIEDTSISDLDSTSSSNSLRTKFLKRLPSDYNPAFAYVVVKKRISTRILVKKGPNYENPPPGTVLDHTVTRFNFKDFFLVPQAVTQGTVTPTHMVSSRKMLILAKSFNLMTSKNWHTNLLICTSIGQALFEFLHPVSTPTNWLISLVNIYTANLVKN